MNYTYPRIGATHRLLERHPGRKTCLCGKKSEYRVDVQYNCMRGDDDVVYACKAHKRDLAFLTAPTQSLAGEL